MNRRQVLKLLGMGIGALELDLDKLLWVPGKKTIFIPKVRKGITESQIVAAELERIIPYIKDIFERDSLFYEVIAKEEYLKMSNREMKVPLELRPGNYDKRRDGKIH